MNSKEITINQKHKNHDRKNVTEKSFEINFGNYSIFKSVLKVATNISFI